MTTNFIYTAADGSYFLQAQTLMMSLVKTQVSATKLVIFGNNWTNKELQALKNLETSNLSTEVIEVDHNQFSNIKLTNKFPLATAYNVLAPRFLISGQARALYVDADVVVTEDLDDLFAMTLTTPVAAVLDAHIGWIASPSMWRPWREEGIAPLAPYLNTGVMLIDIESWNKAEISERILEYLERYELPCVDQDAINLVLRGKFDQLAPRYNLMPYHYLWKFRYVDAISSDLEIGDAIQNPAIIHFHRSFLGKPWTYGAIHPATKLWRSLADEAHPRWRKHFDWSGLARRKAAKFAKMLEIDSRAKQIKSL